MTPVPSPDPYCLGAADLYGCAYDDVTPEQCAKFKKAFLAALPAYGAFTGDPKTTTIEAGKRWARERFDKGCTCPLCGQFVKRYKRPLNSSMAVFMIMLRKYQAAHPSEAWVDVPKLLSTSKTATARGGDYAKLTGWGLIEPLPDGVREDGSKRVGLYRMTELGKSWSAGQAAVPKYVFFYNESPLAKQPPVVATVTIEQALGSKFNYADLMKGP